MPLGAERGEAPSLGPQARGRVAEARGPRPWARLGVGVPLVAAAIPPIVIARATNHYGLDLPYWDQWSFVPTLVAAMEGHLRFGMLWEQSNEHRLVLPKLLMIGLAHLTRWNVRAEMAASVVVALGTFAALVALIGRTVRPLAPVLSRWLVLATSVLLFSMCQWENWTWGWQVQIFMNVFASVLAACGLAWFGATWRGVTTMCAAGLVAVLSFASGLCLLAAIPLGLAFAAAVRRGNGVLPKIAVATGFGAAVFGLYMRGFQHPAHHPSPLIALAQPGAYLYYVLAYVGSSLGSWSPLHAAIAGGCGVLALVVAAGWICSREPACRAALPPWILLACYALLTGAMTGIGRLGFGVGQALAPRYTTITALFWVSCLAVVGLAIARALRNATLGTAHLVLVATAACALTLAVEGFAWSSYHGYNAIRQRRDAVRRARACARYPDKAADDCLRLVFPDAATVRAGAKELRRVRLGLFRDAQ